MFLLGDVWDTLKGVGISAIIAALAAAYVRIFRTRRKEDRDDNADVISKYRQFISDQDERISRLEKKEASNERRISNAVRAEEKCQRRVGRLAVIIQSHQERLRLYESAMREVGLPTQPAPMIQLNDEDLEMEMIPDPGAHLEGAGDDGT